jgi:DNA-binding NarL/FixJ family response regulator
MSDASIIWLLDDREIRRAAICGYLTMWAHQSSIDIHPVESVDAIPPIGADGAGLVPQLCMLVVGGTSLSDPDMALRVRSVVRMLAGRPLALLSDIDSTAEVSLAIELGADGLITTKMATSVAVAALNFILSGGTYFEKASLSGICAQRGRSLPDAKATAAAPTANGVHAARDMMAAGVAGPGTPADGPGLTDLAGLGFQPTLTHRQREIVEMLKLGRSNKEIARILDISDATVKIFVRQVMKKYGAINRTQVALLASDAMSHVDITPLRTIPSIPPGAVSLLSQTGNP